MGTSSTQWRVTSPRSQGAGGFHYHTSFPAGLCHREIYHVSRDQGLYVSLHPWTFLLKARGCWLLPLLEHVIILSPPQSWGGERQGSLSLSSYSLLYLFLLTNLLLSIKQCILTGLSWFELADCAHLLFLFKNILLGDKCNLFLFIYLAALGLSSCMWDL